MVCPLLASAPLAAQNSDNHNFDVSKQLDIFNSVYRDLDLYYVDTLNAEKNIRNALDYMLQQLDPYTEYYPQENTEDLKLLSTGKYSGIGSSIQFQEASGRCVIGLPYENSPAATSGLLPGDILLSIDGKDLGTCHEKDADSTVEMTASPGSFRCFSIMALKPPMVSPSSPAMEPLRSRINTSSVRFFFI